MSLDEFQQAAADYGTYNDRVRRVIYDGTDGSGDRVGPGEVTMETTTAGGLSTDRYSYASEVPMVREDGAWRIDQALVFLDPGPVHGAGPDRQVGGSPMQTARRLYVYLVSGAALGFVLFGLHSLLQVLLDALGLRGDVLGGNVDTSQELSVASGAGRGGHAGLAGAFGGSPNAASRSAARDRRRSANQRSVRFSSPDCWAILLALGAGAVSDLFLSALDSALSTDNCSARAPPVPSPRSWWSLPPGCTTRHSAVATWTSRNCTAQQSGCPGPTCTGPRSSGLAWSLFALVPLLDSAVHRRSSGNPLVPSPGAARSARPSSA